jgi:hypothetical protein
MAKIKLEQSYLFASKTYTGTQVQAEKRFSLPAHGRGNENYLAFTSASSKLQIGPHELKNF